jgi:glutaredoxin
MFKEYLLYTKVNCPFCVKAIATLVDRKVDYKVLTADVCPTKFIQSLKEAYSHPSFPMVFGVDRDTGTYTWIGGCDNLMEHLDKS